MSVDNVYNTGPLSISYEYFSLLICIQYSGLSYMEQVCDMVVTFKGHRINLAPDVWPTSRKMGLILYL